MNTRDVELSQFSARLREAAILRGFVSSRSRSGVNLSELARAVSVSSEMARRYADGIALPSQAKLRELARWLGVSIEWLIAGEGSIERDQGLDVEILARCIETAGEAQEVAGYKLPPRQIALLISELYRETLRGASPSVRQLASAIRALH